MESHGYGAVSLLKKKAPVEAGAFPPIRFSELNVTSAR